ncbi:unnamed protein product, partial [Hymenolepis diminuta]
MMYTLQIQVPLRRGLKERSKNGQGTNITPLHFQSVNTVNNYDHLNRSLFKGLFDKFLKIHCIVLHLTDISLLIL